MDTIEKYRNFAKNQNMFINKQIESKRRKIEIINEINEITGFEYSPDEIQELERSIMDLEQKKEIYEYATV